VATKLLTAKLHSCYAKESESGVGAGNFGKAGVGVGVRTDILLELVLKPFAFPCAGVDSKTVITHFNQLFALFGMPAYIHSHRGAAFMSNELTMFLRQRGIAYSRTSVYNVPGNGQCERYNGIIWTAIKLDHVSDAGHCAVGMCFA